MNSVKDMHIPEGKHQIIQFEILFQIKSIYIQIVYLQREKAFEVTSFKAIIQYRSILNKYN